jgi:hypothetical protein
MVISLVCHKSTNSFQAFLAESQHAMGNIYRLEWSPPFSRSLQAALVALHPGTDKLDLSPTIKDDDQGDGKN